MHVARAIVLVRTRACRCTKQRRVRDDSFKDVPGVEWMPDGPISDTATCKSVGIDA